MKIYVVGDSISIQYGPYLQAYLNGVIDYSRKEGEEEALLNLDHPQGANGGDSGMVLSFLRAKKDGMGINADLLLLNCGLHDIKTNPVTTTKQVPIDKYRENLKAIVQTVNEMKCPMVWIRTTPCCEETHNREGMAFHRFSADCDAYNLAADQIMDAAGVTMLDLHTFTLNLGAELYCDHVHFNDHVRQKQAAFIAGWILAFAKVRVTHPFPKA
ncbi:MAG: SGNH/GDSL hydrolase family protein [Planctomycetes bacterium]|nr:SGNH/GDSL hydrolase family protein [Planctomycetota bacterium]